MNPHCGGPGAVSKAEQSDGGVWSADLCGSFECGDGCGSVFDPDRSEVLGAKDQFLGALQLRQSDRTDDESGSDDDRSDVWGAVCRSAAERGCSRTRGRSRRTFVLESSISITRTTPAFPTPNHTDPAVKFTDGLYEGFNAAAGSVMSAFGNLFQGQQNVDVDHGRGHALKAGVEARLNRDTTYFGISPNGEYDFGGGTVYSPMFIPSQSGTHNVQSWGSAAEYAGEFLVGYPFAYTIAVAPPYFSSGAHIGPAAINRNDVNFYAQDTWKINATLRSTMDCGGSCIRRSASGRIGPSGFLSTPPTGSAGVCHQSAAGISDRWNGWGPRVQAAWQAPSKLAGARGRGDHGHSAEYLAGQLSYGVDSVCGLSAAVTASKARRLRTGSRSRRRNCRRRIRRPARTSLPSGNTKKVAANTVMDVNRYQNDLAALTPGHQLSAAESERRLTGDLGMAFCKPGRWAGAHVSGLTADAGYVGTERWAAADRFPTGIPGARPGVRAATRSSTARAPSRAASGSSP